MKVFIGYDPAEHQAFQVARRSLWRRSDYHDVTPLKAERLAASGLLTRPVDARGGELYDFRSNAPQSTEFAISRFLVPILAQSGWALFTDCDVVFLTDIEDLMLIADHTKAVMVVKHEQQPTEHEKMCGKTQTTYSRKNWSSVMLFNCDHPANRRLTVDDVNRRPGRDLHNFFWLHDDEIGELPPEWNWLVGVQPKPKDPRIAHFTLGGPWFANWPGAEHDDIWTKEAL